MTLNDLVAALTANPPGWIHDGPHLITPDAHVFATAPFVGRAHLFDGSCAICRTDNPVALSALVLAVATLLGVSLEDQP